MEKDLFLPEAVSVSDFAVLGSPWGLLAAWLALINVVAFFVYGLDKLLSKRARAQRVPEKNLLLLAVAGGSVGALLGMRVFHHKTLHRAFRYGIPAILALHLLLAGTAVYRLYLR